MLRALLLAAVAVCTAGLCGTIAAQSFHAKPIRIIHTPDMKEKLSSQGADPIGNSPAEMAKWLAAEKDRWAKLIKATGFKLEQ